MLHEPDVVSPHFCFRPVPNTFPSNNIRQGERFCARLRFPMSLGPHPSGVLSYVRELFEAIAEMWLYPNATTERQKNPKRLFFRMG